MKNSGAFSSVIVGLVLLVTASCSSDRAPMAPAAVDLDSTSVLAAADAPNAALLGDLLGGLGETVGTVTGTVTGTLGGVTGGLLACDVQTTSKASQVIGPSGGVIRVGPHTLVVPRGALTQTVRIDATAPQGNIVLVDFAPHGLNFRRPVVLTMSYRDCGLVGGLLGGLLLDIVYIDNKRNVLEVLPSLNDLLGRRVTAPLDHFSGYALADRQSGTTDPELDGGL